MQTPDEERWTPKVHPLARDAAPEDPLELIAEPVAGDPDVMLDCILQEFAWMGWNEEQLFALFHHPGYPVLRELCRAFGEEEVARRLRELVARGGVLRFREVVVEPALEPELVQIKPLSPC